MLCVYKCVNTIKSEYNDALCKNKMFIFAIINNLSLNTALTLISIRLKRCEHALLKHTSMVGFIFVKVEKKMRSSVIKEAKALTPQKASTATCADGSEPFTRCRKYTQFVLYMKHKYRLFIS